MPGAVALARETGRAAAADGDLGSAADPHREAAGGPAPWAAGLAARRRRPCTSTRRRPARGDRPARRRLQGMLDGCRRRPVHRRTPGRRTAGTRPTSGVPPRTPAQAQAVRVGAAERGRAVVAAGRAGSARRRVGSRCASASRRCVSVRWCVGVQRAGQVGGERRDRVDELVEPAADRGRREQQADAARPPPVTARNAVTGSRSDSPPTPAYSAPFTKKPWKR